MLTSPRVVSHFPSIGGGGGSTSTQTTNVTFSLANNGVSPCSISTVGHSYPPPKFLLGSSCCRTRCSHRISDQWSFHPLPGTFSFDIPHHRLETWNSYQQDLPVIAKRKLLIIGGARGLWSLPIRQPVRASGISYEKPMNPFHAEMDTLIMSTDINPSPGFSRVGLLASFLGSFFTIYYLLMNVMLLLSFLFSKCCFLLTSCTLFADCNEVEQE